VIPAPTSRNGILTPGKRSGFSLGSALCAEHRGAWEWLRALSEVGQEFRGGTALAEARSRGADRVSRWNRLLALEDRIFAERRLNLYASGIIAAYASAFSYPGRSPEEFGRSYRTVLCPTSIFAGYG
jgi:hypothetical protein